MFAQTRLHSGYCGSLTANSQKQVNKSEKGGLFSTSFI